MPRKDLDAMLNAGMTAAEAECLQITATLHNALLELPKQHPADAEWVPMIHRIQDFIFARPTYRRYLDSSLLTLYSDNNTTDPMNESQ